jgi:hypothetical protein
MKRNLEAFFARAVAKCCPFFLVGAVARGQV